MTFKKMIEVRWSDIDAYQHVTHTAYASFATHTRVEWLVSVGCPISELINLNFAGVLVKEQTEFLREVFLGELVTVELYFAGSSENYAKWKFVSKIFNSKEKVAALHSVYGVWLDTTTRRVAPPPGILLEKLKGLTRSEDFEILK